MTLICPTMNFDSQRAPGPALVTRFPRDPTNRGLAPTKRNFLALQRRSRLQYMVSASAYVDFDRTRLRIGRRRRRAPYQVPFPLYCWRRSGTPKLTRPIRPRSPTPLGAGRRSGLPADGRASPRSRTIADDVGLRVCRPPSSPTRSLLLGELRLLDGSVLLPRDRNRINSREANGPGIGLKRSGRTRQLTRLRGPSLAALWLWSAQNIKCAYRTS